MFSYWLRYVGVPVYYYYYYYYCSSCGCSFLNIFCAASVIGLLAVDSAYKNK
jgi:hypothetical protein